MANKYFDLTDRVAFITGCSSGLGVQMAKALASQGCNIVAVARRQKLIEEVAADITKTYGVKAIGVPCDITDTERVNAAVDKVLKEFGRIDILINNAGTGSGVTPTEDVEDAQFEREIGIDLTGSFKVVRAVAKKAMLPAGYGRVINIASMYGMVGSNITTCAAYHAAKGGVVNLTRALAAEWGNKGITVNAICPGYFETALTKDFLNGDFFKEYSKTMIPLRRHGKEGELDTAAIFLSSPFSSYVNGVILPIDGGYTAM